MPEILIADIGGTNSRFALVGPGGRPQMMVAIENDAVASLEEAIARYIGAVGAKPRTAVLGIAGPLNGDLIEMTNRAWRCRISDLARQFGLEAIRVINDFEAVAWSLESLQSEDLRVIGPAIPAHQGPKVVLGPGTGLGVAAWVRTPVVAHAIATESGHITFGPASPDEEPIFARLRSAAGYVSAELILSGPGLVRLHAALHGDRAKLAADEIVARAHDGDPASVRTVALFVRLLGRFAGDMALVFKATGGVYIAGGVAQRLGPLIDAATFRAALEAHPPYHELLRGIPTRLITYDQPGLLGCAAMAATMR